jgi:environmental stress-induced protein Ves
VNLRCIHADDIPAQAWRNGGGQTRELLAWPVGEHWQLRISRADIDRDGPFSSFPQVERWFAVLRGNGVELDFNGAARTVALGDDAVRFDGAAAPGCRLTGGPTQDLNLMLRGGSGFLRRWERGSACLDASAMRGLYTTMDGRWTCGIHSQDIAADTLLWSEHGAAGPWTFEPSQATTSATDSAWWLGFTPGD